MTVSALLAKAASKPDADLDKIRRAGMKAQAVSAAMRGAPNTVPVDEFLRMFQRTSPPEVPPIQPTLRQIFPSKEEAKRPLAYRMTLPDGRRVTLKSDKPLSQYDLDFALRKAAPELYEAPRQETEEDRIEEARTRSFEQSLRGDVPEEWTGPQTRERFVASKERTIRRVAADMEERGRRATATTDAIVGGVAGAVGGTLEKVPVIGETLKAVSEFILPQNTLDLLLETLPVGVLLGAGGKALKRAMSADEVANAVTRASSKIGVQPERFAKAVLDGDEAAGKMFRREIADEVQDYPVRGASKAVDAPDLSQESRTTVATRPQVPTEVRQAEMPATRTQTVPEPDTPATPSPSPSSSSSSKTPEPVKAPAEVRQAEMLARRTSSEPDTPATPSPSSSSKTPEPAKAPETKTSGQGGTVPPESQVKATSTPAEPAPETKAANASMAKDAESLGLNPERDPIKARRIMDAEPEARRIADPRSVARDVIDSPRPVTDAETVAFARRVSQIKAEMRALAAKRLDARSIQEASELDNRIGLLREEFSDLRQALDVGGTKLSDAFRARQGILSWDASDELMVRYEYRKAAGGRASAEVEERLAESARKLADAEAREAKLIAELEKAKTTRVAAAARQEANRAKRNQEVQAKAKAEREEIVKRLLNTPLQAGVPANLLPDLGKLALSYAKEGAASVDDILRMAKADIGDRFPELDQTDIANGIDALRGPGATKTEIGQRIAELRKEAARLSTRGKESARDAALRREAELGRRRAEAEFKKAKADAERLARKIEEAEAKADAKWAETQRKALEAARRRSQRAEETLRKFEERKAELEAKKAEREAAKTPKAIAQVKAKIAELEERLKLGDYWVPAKAEKTVDAELLKLRTYKRKLDSEMRQAIEDAAKSDIARAFAQVWNAPRVIKASFDISAPGRQGWMLTLAHPGLAAKAFRAQMSGLASEEGLQRTMENIVRNPWHQDAVNAGVEFAQGAAEELFRNAPKFWKKYNPYRASERAYSAYLDTLRMETFAKIADGAGNDPAVLKDVARYINIASGRGLVEKQLERGIAGLNGYLFAPKFLLSRFQAGSLRPIRDAATSAGRKAVVQEYAKVVAGMASILGMARMAGAEVHTDPASSDFLKVKIGDTRIDFLAGIAQAYVLASRFATGRYVASTSGKESNIWNPEYGKTDVNDVFTRFVLSKAHPSIGMLVKGAQNAAGKAEDAFGMEYNPGNWAKELLAPISVAELIEAFQDNGWEREDALILLGFLGFGVQKYSAKTKGEKQDRRPGG